jgi:hypothetical protein
VSINQHHLFVSFVGVVAAVVVVVLLYWQQQQKADTSNNFTKTTVALATIQYSGLVNATAMIVHHCPLCLDPNSPWTGPKPIFLFSHFIFKLSFRRLSLSEADRSILTLYL